MIPETGKEVSAFNAKLQQFVQYFKGEPSVHVIRYRRGQVVEHGPGLAFWYLPFNTSIAAVPVVTQDAPFIFNEATRDFQAVAIQGSLSYRLTAPIEAAKLLDFTIDPVSGRYRGKDPEKLAMRLINAVQAHTRTHVNALALEEALTKVRDLAAVVLGAVNTEGSLRSLGVLVEGLHFTAVTATPEMHKALEADYREALQQKADQAIYARRAAAIEEERRIKSREMDTEVELENRKKNLVDMQARNHLALAEAEAKAEELKLSPYGELAPQVLIGLALKEWASAGGQIGNLTITPDMLGQLVGWVAGTRK
ncbi:MAG: hypothetical protein A2150_08010 [Candidatus Muproteobacteria bacterium RBG_16_64_11]|uniref:Band 7 domain-containing protein n=1 Tax=Candidatus Muproteobacteria bacterium RBG_16_64_11 TaxID=1817758 RepID=A0A1F6TA98_9PROT|nr:MAG: hypothetical protein A2150_08010 [Candidatus Muproteobacteria bacterium RBG_16_64_11]